MAFVRLDICPRFKAFDGRCNMHLSFFLCTIKALNIYFASQSCFSISVLIFQESNKAASCEGRAVDKSINRNAMQ